MPHCYKCQTDKPSEEFYSDKTRKSGLSSKCKDCARTFKKRDFGKPKTKKLCRKCAVIRPIENFDLNRNHGDGYQSRCKDCRRTSKRTEWSLSSDEERFRKLLIKYGLMYHEYEALLMEQDYKCKICKVNFEESNLVPNIDHSHKTLEVRGILCMYCNVGLGAFKDDIDSLYAAIKYLGGSVEI